MKELKKVRGGKIWIVSYNLFKKSDMNLYIKIYLFLLKNGI